VKVEELSTLDKLKRLLKEKPNTYNQIELARRLGVSRERIRQMVNTAGLRPLLRVQERKRYFCSRCGKEIKPGNRFCAECRYAMHHITLTCTQCGKEFAITMSDYKRRLKRRKTSAGFFCSRRCFGMYIGRVFGFRPKLRSYPENKLYGGICAFCGTPFSNMRELLRHRNTTRELNDPANRRKLINYRRRHTVWLTLARFRVNQDTLRAIMKGLPTVRHSQSTTVERKIHDATSITTKTTREG
jgi:RNase P subunit RPR2